MKDSNVLITEGTGSFGHVMAQHVLDKGCAEVRIFSRGEAKQDEMRRRLVEPRMKFFIGDIRDDIMIKKAAASTVGVLAEAVLELFKSKSRIKLIGTRHAEKPYETLATAQELAASEDRGNNIRARMDNRDLNYDAYFVDGNEETATLEEFNSDNCERLDVEAAMALLRSLPEVQAELDKAGLG